MPNACNINTSVGAKQINFVYIERYQDSAKELIKRKFDIIGPLNNSKYNTKKLQEIQIKGAMESIQSQFHLTGPFCGAKRYISCSYQYQTKK